MPEPIIAINDKGEQLWWDGSKWVPVEPDPTYTAPPPAAAETPKGPLDTAAHFRPPMPPWKPADEQLDIALPTANQAIDALPIAGGIAGSSLGPVGTGAGAMVGEGARMGIRKATGQAPATGFVQTALGLDPNNPATAGVNVLAEGVGGGATDAVAKLFARLGVPWIRKKATEVFAGGLTKDPLAQKSLARKIADAGIEDQLPVGGQRHIRKYAERMADAPGGAGHDVGKVYEQVGGTPGSYTRTPAGSGRPSVVANLTEQRNASMPVPGNFKIVKVLDRKTKQLVDEVVPVSPATDDAALYDAFDTIINGKSSAGGKKPVAGLVPLEERARLPRMDAQGNITAPPIGVDVAQMRRVSQSYSDIAKRGSTKAYGVGTKVPDPQLAAKIQANKAGAAAIKDEVHTLTPNPVTLPARDPLTVREKLKALTTLDPTRVGNEWAAQFPGAAKALGVGNAAGPRVLTNSVPAKQLTTKQADAVFNAWKSVEEGSPASQDIVSRWLIARMWAGKTGTAAGAMVANGLLLRSASAKTLRSLANALRAGDDAAINQIMRGLADQASFSNDQPTAGPQPALQQYISANE